MYYFIQYIGKSLVYVSEKEEKYSFELSYSL